MLLTFAPLLAPLASAAFMAAGFLAILAVVDGLSELERF